MVGVECEADAASRVSTGDSAWFRLSSCAVECVVWGQDEEAGGDEQKQIPFDFAQGRLSGLGARSE